MILLTAIVDGAIVGYLLWSWFDLLTNDGEQDWWEFK